MIWGLVPALELALGWPLWTERRKLVFYPRFPKSDLLAVCTQIPWRRWALWTAAGGKVLIPDWNSWAATQSPSFPSHGSSYASALWLSHRFLSKANRILAQPPSNTSLKCWLLTWPRNQDLLESDSWLSHARQWQISEPEMSSPRLYTHLFLFGSPSFLI